MERLRPTRRTPESEPNLEACEFLDLHGRPGATGGNFMFIQGILSDPVSCATALNPELDRQLDPVHKTFVGYREPLQSHEKIAAEIAEHLLGRLVAIRDYNTENPENEISTTINIVAGSFGARMLPYITEKLQEPEMKKKFEGLKGHLNLIAYDPATNPEDNRATRELAALEALTGWGAPDRFAKHVLNIINRNVKPDSQIGRAVIGFLTRSPWTGYPRKANEESWLKTQRRAYKAESKMVKKAQRNSARWMRQVGPLMNDRVPLEDLTDGQAGGITWTVAAISNDAGNRIVPGKKWVKDVETANAKNIARFEKETGMRVPEWFGKAVLSLYTPHYAFAAYPQRTVESFKNAISYASRKRDMYKEHGVSLEEAHD